MKRSKLDFRRSLLIGGAVSGAALLSRQAAADTAFTNFSFPGTGFPTSRTTPNRITDVLNVMEFGAKGDGSTDDTAALRAAIRAMNNWTSLGGSNVKGATLYFPPGTYLVAQQGGDATDAACFQLDGTNPSTGRIVGAGPGATIIRGTNNYNMIFNTSGNANCISELSHLTVTNFSTVIGTGAVRLNTFNPITLVEDVALSGMTCLELGYFGGNAVSVTTTGASGGTYPNYGSIGIHLAGGSVLGWNTSNGGHDIGLMAGGNTGGSILGCRCEEAVTGMLLGQRLGTATLCTIASGVLTVTSGSHQYPDPATTGLNCFTATDRIVGTGIPPTASVAIIAQLTQTNGDPPGGRGTYSLSGASGITISSPVPMTSYHRSGLYCTLVSGFEAEGCGIGLSAESVNGCTIQSCILQGGIGEAATNYGSKTGTSLCQLLLYSANGSTIQNIRIPGNSQQASVLIRENASNPSFTGCVLDNFVVGGTPTLVTTTAAFIDNGLSFPNPSGTPGTVLSLPAGSLSGGQMGLGALVSGASIPTGANTPYADHGFASVGVPYPSGQYAPAGGPDGGSAPCQIGLICPGGNLNITGVAITLTHGTTYGQLGSTINSRNPVSNLTGNLKAGLFFRNCDSVNDRSLGMHFADLPGQSGVLSANLMDGMEYDIVDCQCAGGTCTTASWLTAASGGGTGAAANRRVRYNAAVPGWQVIG